MPAPRVKPAAEAAGKWSRRASAATPDYQSGVQGAGSRWATNAAAANQNYTQAVTQAASAGRFAKGVAKAGAGKYERGAMEKGVQRYGPGVAVAESDYNTAVAPYLTAIGSLDLPARGPRGADANVQRVAAIAKALRTLKTSR